MSLTLFGVKIKIEYSIFVFLAISLITNNYYALYVLLFSIMHEFGHIISLLAFGGKIELLTFSYYGIGLKCKRNFSMICELVFLLSGVAINLVFCIFDICTPINKALLLINILPIYPLDGGRALKTILDKFFAVDISQRFFKALSLILILALISVSLYLKNINLFFITIYLIVYSLNNSFD